MEWQPTSLASSELVVGDICDIWLKRPENYPCALYYGRVVNCIWSGKNWYMGDSREMIPPEEVSHFMKIPEPPPEEV